MRNILLDASRVMTLLVVMGLMLPVFYSVQARDRSFFFGGGLASTQVSGDYNEDYSSQFYGPFEKNPKTIHGVNLDNGSGYALQAGLSITRNFGFELILSNTAHDGTNQNEFPGETLNADINSTTIGPWGMFSVMDSLEVLGRTGWGQYFVGVPGSMVSSTDGVRKGSDLSGYGYVFGVGALYSIKRLGIEISLNRHDLTLDSGSEQEDKTLLHGDSGIKEVRLILTTALLIFTFNFGGEF